VTMKRRYPIRKTNIPKDAKWFKTENLLSFLGDAKIDVKRLEKLLVDYVIGISWEPIVIDGDRVVNPENVLAALQIGIKRCPTVFKKKKRR